MSAMRTFVYGSILVLVTLSSAVPALANNLQLTIGDGRVTLIAREVPVQQILAEWARIGQTQIVNGDKLVGPPLTLQLIDVPEAEALAAVLRSAAGYMVAPRSEVVAQASRFDRVLILATSNAPAAGPATFTPPPMPPPAMPFEQPPFDPVMNDPANEPSFDPAFNPNAPGGFDPAAYPGVSFPQGAPARPPETMFDYANPPQLERFRQMQMEQLQQMQQGVPQDQPPAFQQPFPSLMPPQGPASGQGNPGPSPVQTSPTPGVIIAPPPPAAAPNVPPGFRNPYGIPMDVQPGSAVGPPMEPDRAKYANPGQPVPASAQ